MEKTLKEIRRDVASALAAVGFDNSSDEALWLLAYVLNRDTSYITLNPDAPFPAAKQACLEAALERRRAYEPLSRIRGTREFWSLNFHLNAATLDPRPDSEALVEAVLERLSDRTQPYRILDLGTGTGCLVISLLKELPQAYGVGMDCSFQALEMARYNAKALGVDQRCDFFQGQWSEALFGPFDIVISNPPYIPYDQKDELPLEVSRFDPCRALYGGADGYECYRALAQDLYRVVSPTGVIALEMGKGQRPEVQSIFQSMGYSILDIKKDLHGVERVLLISYERRRKTGE